MKLSNILLAALFVVFIGCDINKDKDNGITLSDINIFALCEGNFGAGNASLWQFDLETIEAAGPVYENLTGNALGDIAQSLTFVDDKLFIINNGSNTIEVLNLADDASFIGTIDLPWAGPREMVEVNGIGYVTTWFAGGIISFDLETLAILDTLECDGMTEDIIADGNNLYASVTLNADWSSGTKVLQLSTTTNQVTNEYDVIAGPGQMLLKDGLLYVTSTYYDVAWNSYVGLCTINTSTGVVTQKDYGVAFNYTSDIIEIDGQLYYVTNSGAAPINNDLTTDMNNQIGALNGVYSAGTYDEYIFFGVTTDFLAPDTVYVYDLYGTMLGSTTVGAIPGSYAAYIK